MMTKTSEVLTLRTAKGTRVDFTGHKELGKIFALFMDVVIDLPMWDEIAETIEGAEEHAYKRCFTCDVNFLYNEEAAESYLTVHFTRSPVLEGK